MRFRTLVLGAVLAAGLVPATGQASHCDVPIYIFSRTAYPGGPYENPVYPLPDPLPTPSQVPPEFEYVPSANSSAVGCLVMRDTVLGGEDEPHELTATDVIYPGADTLSVRLLANTDPESVEAATLTFAGETYALAMANTLDVLGEPATYLDSQDISIDPATTVSGGDAVATICLVGEDECYTRTYSTVG